MRSLVMHKLGTVEPVTFDPPSPEVMRDMSALVGELLASKAMENGAGLNPKHPRTRVTVEAGRLIERAGPLTGTNELLAHVAMIEVADKAEGVELGKRYAKAVGGDVTLEVGRVTDPWDIGMMPVPATRQPEKYLLLHMADASSEAGGTFSADQNQRVGALMNELREQKKLVMPLEHVMPSREGRRLKFKAGKRTSLFDGPFAESKELISGFCLVNLPTLDAVLALAERYGSILRELEVDVLPLR